VLKFTLEEYFDYIPGYLEKEADERDVRRRAILIM